MNSTANDTARNESQVRQLTAQKDRPARTFTFQDSHNVLTPSTSRDEAPRSDPCSLRGFQKDPQLHQRVAHKTAKAPIDL